MKSKSFLVTALCAAIAVFVSMARPIFAEDETANSTALERAYHDDIQPLLKRFCYECHAGDRMEAEIDLAASATIDQVRKQPQVWQKVREMLDSGQMPPKEATQPNDAQQTRLRKWVHDWLKDVAKRHAGDPGPVVLRRLTNAEYNYSVRELTGIDSLDPTHEFPVDGAAGEGFTNAGAAQGMSPSLITKYLDAAKEVSQHAVLHPDGIRFSKFTTRRDHTDELLARIQAFYRRFTEDGGGTVVNLDGNKFDTNQGGLLPLKKYLAATIEQRDALASGSKTIEQVAHERSLSDRYLGKLWASLTDERQVPILWLAELRSKWRDATVGDVDAIAGEIAKVQQMLWKFNLVGQIGRQGGPQAWMEAVSPITASQEVRHKLPDSPGDDVLLYLLTHDLGDGNDRDIVVWQRPRIEFPAATHPPILLRDVRALAGQVEKLVADETGRTAQYLDAVVGLRSSTESTEELAKSRNLNPILLQSWAAISGLGRVPEITGHLTQPLTRAHGYEAINGWGDGGGTPSLLTNQSNEPISFLTLTVPARGVTVHPSPTLESIIAWQSPFDGQVNIDGLVADADDKCGNGFAWRAEVNNAAGVNDVLNGTIDNGGEQRISSEAAIDVSKGDVVSLVVNARDNSHVCDTTHVDITLSEVGGEGRVWNLATDVVDDILSGNPVSDSYGHARTWHFCAAPSERQTDSSLPAGSALAKWHAAVVGGKPSDQINRLTEAVQQVVTEPNAESLGEADRKLKQQLVDWKGPLQWLRFVDTSATVNATDDADSRYGIEADRFGTAPDGSAVDRNSLCLQAPQLVEVRLPAQLAAGAEFVANGTLHSETGKQGSVQFQVLTDKPQRPSIAAAPVVVGGGSQARQKVEEATKEFRELFPAALCYARIVPVDEVVTLNLFYREDEHLKRLMLDSSQAAELDRLWDQLYFVSHEPLALAVAFEQIKEFATQDRPDLVVAFEPLEKVISDRAEAFRQRLVRTEPTHVAAVIEFANLLWRRPLTDNQQQNLRRLYDDLRESELSHDEAIRLTLARVFTAPAFLYKLEQQPSGSKAEPVSDLELATRLSYFLWSSQPDGLLRKAAEAGHLSGEKNSNNLLAETLRMLKDPRTRRLAIHFACQWLHVRDFDKNDDKNEALYPEFAALRHEMYEETVRFFEDMFRNDGSILDLVDADHTFLNEALAKHYGIDSISGSDWQRADRVRAKGRGGILAMATILASQSGASRTSPILRGNWVSETLLGERLPRPPANVPVLPEAVPSGLTARELIERHSSTPECAKCHERIDPYGFALEQFDAIGRLRPAAVDTKTKLMDGTPIEGIDGLREYLMTARRNDVVRQFCRKLLGYALGREVMLSDEPLLDEIQRKLEANHFRFSIAVEAIVGSRQFREIRGSAFSM